MKILQGLLTLTLWMAALTASAQTKAPEGFTIIEQQPEGTMRVYNRSGQTRKEDFNEPGLITTQKQSGTITFVYGADNAVYIQFPINDLNALYDGWVRGTMSSDGRTITVPTGQYVCYTRSFDMAVQVWLMTPSTTFDSDIQQEVATYVVDESVTEVTYTVDDDGTIRLEGTDENHILSAVNRAFGDTFSYLDFEWIGYGDFASVYTLNDDDASTPPAGLQTQQLIATTGYHDGMAWEPYEDKVLLGFNGSDAWLKGLTHLAPGGWLKGHREGNTMTFVCGQMVGTYGTTPLYVLRAVPDDEGNPVVADSFSFTYDAARQAWVSFDDIMVSTSRTDISYVAYYMGMTLSAEADRLNDVPDGLSLVDYTMDYQEPDNRGRLVSKTYVSSGTERDGCVYLQNLTPFAPEGYAVGTIGSDGRVTFASPQLLGTFVDDETGIRYPIYFQAFDGSSGELLPEVTFSRDAATRVLDKASSAIGIGINKTGLLCQQYLYNVTLTPVSVEETVNIGYCPDELAEPLSPMAIATEGSSSVSAAIHLPRTTLMHYQGMTITRLRFAVRKGFEDMAVWIRTDLNASPVVVQSVTNVEDGWNEVVLNRPLVIDGSDLYIGYSGTQPEGFEGILSYGEGNEYTSWLALNSQWADYHADGLGRLYIQAVAEGFMQQRDATIISLVTDKMAYAPTEPLVVSGELENLGATDLQGFTLSFSIDGSQIATQASNQLLRPDEVTTFSCELPLDFLKDGEHELSVSVGDQTETVSTQQSTFYVYTTTYPRTLLLEHFTSLPCVNCPRDDAKLEEAVEGRSDVAWVSHHVGYADDEFTLDIERTLTRFGVDGNPYVMLDRTAFNEGEPPAFTISSYDAGTVGTILDYAATMPAFVQLAATATVSGDELTINVSGEGLSFVTDLYPRAALHVYIVEDQVTAVGVQAGDANKHQHDNIVRQFVTPVRGTAPSWVMSDGALPTFSSQFTATLNPVWNQQELRVVAFLTAQPPSATTYPTGEVLNTTQVPVSSAVGVQSVTQQSQPAEQWYSLDGRRIAAPANKGLYIRNGRKVIK